MIKEIFTAGAVIVTQYLCLNEQSALQMADAMASSEEEYVETGQYLHDTDGCIYVTVRVPVALREKILEFTTFENKEFELWRGTGRVVAGNEVWVFLASKKKHLPSF